AYAMALDGLFFADADRVHGRYRTPHRAIVVQGAVAVMLLGVLRRFPSVLDYTTFAIVLATMADTTALYALRRRRPTLPRPCRACGRPPRRARRCARAVPPPRPDDRPPPGCSSRGDSRSRRRAPRWRTTGRRHRALQGAARSRSAARAR